MDKNNLIKYAIVAGLGLAAFMYIKKKGLAGVAAGAVGLVDDAGSGVVIGLGELFGVPQTDADRCMRAKASGDWWEQSKYCTAQTFLGSVGGSIYDTANYAASAPFLGIGDAFGIPRTNQTACEKAKASGDWWEQSKSCTATEFISNIFQ